MQHAPIDVDAVNQPPKAPLGTRTRTHAQQFGETPAGVSERAIEGVEQHLGFRRLAVDIDLNSFRHSRAGVGYGDVVPAFRRECLFSLEANRIVVIVAGEVNMHLTVIQQNAVTAALGRVLHAGDNAAIRCGVRVDPGKECESILDIECRRVSCIEPKNGS